MRSRNASRRNIACTSSVGRRSSASGCVSFHSSSASTSPALTAPRAEAVSSSRCPRCLGDVEARRRCDDRGRTHAFHWGRAQCVEHLRRCRRWCTTAAGAWRSWRRFSAQPSFALNVASRVKTEPNLALRSNGRIKPSGRHGLGTVTDMDRSTLYGLPAYIHAQDRAPTLLALRHPWLDLPPLARYNLHIIQPLIARTVSILPSPAPPRRAFPLVMLAAHRLRGIALIDHVGADASRTTESVYIHRAVA